jgi:hypothetical protein
VESIEIHTTIQALLPGALFCSYPGFGMLILEAGKDPGDGFHFDLRSFLTLSASFSKDDSSIFSSRAKS